MICIFTCFIAQNFGPQSFNLFEEVVRVLPPRSLNCHCSRHPAQYRRDSETDECKLNGGSQKWAEQGSHQVWRQAIKSVTLEGFDWRNRLFFTRSKMFSSHAPLLPTSTLTKLVTSRPADSKTSDTCENWSQTSQMLKRRNLHFKEKENLADPAFGPH